MTLQLSKCIYGVETNPNKTPFGFTNNQIRSNGIIQNAGWFNYNAEKLGNGDLSLKDMENISKNISAGEVFFVLSESDCGPDFPSHLNRIEPGIEYVVKKTVWVIFKAVTTSIFRIRNDIIKAELNISNDGVVYHRIPRSEIIKVYATKNIPKAIEPTVQLNNAPSPWASKPLVYPKIVPSSQGNLFIKPKIKNKIIKTIP